MVEVQGENVWWRWANYSTEPWARLWHVKYSRDIPTHQLVRFNEDLDGSPIWIKVVSGQWIVQVGQVDQATNSGYGQAVWFSGQPVKLLGQESENS